MLSDKVILFLFPISVLLCFAFKISTNICLFDVVGLQIWSHLFLLFHLSSVEPIKDSERYSDI